MNHVFILTGKPFNLKDISMDPANTHIYRLKMPPELYPHDRLSSKTRIMLDDFDLNCDIRDRALIVMEPNVASILVMLILQTALVGLAIVPDLWIIKPDVGGKLVAASTYLGEAYDFIRLHHQHQREKELILQLGKRNPNDTD